jgi:hypothetical protein
MTGTAWALARVFGRLTTVFHIDRLTVERIARHRPAIQALGVLRRAQQKDAGLHELALMRDSGEMG